MNDKKNIKLLITVSVIFVLAVVVTAVIILSLSGQDELSRALSLGDKFLSDMDYDSAIREYSRVLSIDPMNQDALVGLAKSYSGKGEPEKARKIFESDLADSDRTDVLRAYGELLEDEEDYSSAIGVVDRLIGMEDKEEDHMWMKELIKKLLDLRRNYSVGPDSTVAVIDGKVFAKGNNVLGALGTNKNLGEDAETDTFEDAEFNGTAVSVYAFGSNSAVIDDSGRLWIAGSGRSGQKKSGASQLIVSAGWTQAADIGPVVRIAGFDSTVFALNERGELWLIGHNAGFTNGSEWLTEWTRITGYGTIIDLQYSDDIVAFMTSDGLIYRTYAPDGTEENIWELVSRDSAMFSLCNYSITALLSDGSMFNYDGGVAMPETWRIPDSWDSYKAPYNVKSMANVGNGLFLLSGDGTVHYISNGTDTEIDAEKDVSYIYSTGGECVLEFNDGNFAVYRSDGSEDTDAFGASR